MTYNNQKTNIYYILINKKICNNTYLLKILKKTQKYNSNQEYSNNKINVHYLIIDSHNNNKYKYNAGYHR